MDYYKTLRNVIASAAATSLITGSALSNPSQPYKEIAYSKGDIKAEIYCEDGKTHKTYTDKCDFTDPTTQKDIEHKINIDVSGGYGTCGIEI